MKAARYTTQVGRAKHSARKNRESLSKRLGKRADAIKARDGHRCVHCTATAESSGAHLQLDHLVPRSLGGLDVESNLVTACRPCNSSRKASPLAVWCRSIGVDARAIRAQTRRRLPLAA